MLTLTTRALQFNPAGKFLFYQQGKSTFLAAASYRRQVHRKLALRIVITRVECFTKSGFTLNQMPFATFGASMLLFRLLLWLRLVNRLNMMACWVMATTNKHTVAPLAEYQFIATLRARHTQLFHDVTVIAV
jgi:hypothetical protein